MEESLFRKIIDECSHYSEIQRIILYLNNEPLTDPYIVERLNYAKEKVPWASAHILTNGSLLTDKLADRLINSKLDWIGFSLHGIKKETVEKAMGLNYELTFRCILNFIDKAKEKRNIKNFIMVTFLRHKYLSLKEKDEAIKFWRDKGIERVSYFDGPVSRAGNVKGLPHVRHKRINGCTSIWANEMIHIVENGDVILCCMDWKRQIILGNVNEQSIYDIWNLQHYVDTRDKRDGRKDSEDNFICKRCEAAISDFQPGSLITDTTTCKTKKVDVLLATLPPWGIENPPIGLGYLDSYIRNKGLKSRVYDFNIYFYNTVDNAYKMLWHVENKNYWSNEKTFPLLYELFKSQIDYAVDKILSTNTDLIGFSVVDPKERITVEVIKRIKNRSREKRIILGGPACSTEEQRNFFIKNIPGYIDYFVVGEGEGTLYEIIKKGKGNLKSSYLSGLAIRDDGKWRHISRQPINPLDNISFPTYEGFDLIQYNGGKSLLVEWSRGCISRCSFCKNYRLVSGYRSRSAEYIFKELEFIVNHYGIKEFTVCDNLMNGDIAQLNGISTKIIQAGLNIRWSGQIAPRKEIDYELFYKMYQAGCRKIQIGVESGSAKILKLMRKIYTPEIAENNIRLAKKAGMEIEIFIMVGFPGEREKVFRETYNFIKRNAKYIDTIKSINTLHLIAGTDVYENYKKYNLKALPEKNWHYLWEAYDNNTYNIRKERAQRLLGLTYELGLKVMETNIKEGKEELLSDIFEKNLPEQLERLKIEINQLQQLPKEKRKIRVLKKHPLSKFILLSFIFIYTLFYIIYFWVYKKLKGRSLLGGS